MPRDTQPVSRGARVSIWMPVRMGRLSSKARNGRDTSAGWARGGKKVNHLEERGWESVRASLNLGL